ncbi:MAG: hypothetical protein ACRDUY_04600 [Nitriliruptorales bacterium]
MGDWGWVGAGYALVYGAMAAYGLWLAARLRRVRPGRDERGEP